MKKGIISLMAAAALGLTAQAHAADAEELAKSKNCLTCHMVDKKLVGPAFKDIAAKYKGDSGAVADLSKKVINGASVTWGPIPMPPNPVSEAEAKTLVEWIMKL
jgi:cytochrome c